MKPTAEQSLAIKTHGRPLVVEAGAGTGKTWVLVERFIYLLETHPDWPLESIIAITFTDKAAREMRARLRKAIEERAIRGLETGRWQEHRLNLDRMQVSTIHSLCSRILRENAIALGIDPGFQVLDQQEADLLKEDAIRSTFIALDEKAHPALELLASLRVYDLRNVLEGMLQKRGILNRLFQNLEDSAGLLQKWGAGLEEMRTAIWEDQLSQDPHLVDVIEAFPDTEIKDPQDRLADTVRLAQDGCHAYHDGDLIGAVKVWLNINLSGGKQDNWGGKESLQVLKGDLKLLRSAAKALENAGALQQIDELDLAAADHLQLWRSLWELLDGVYSEIKEGKQALDFDDLELFTEGLLKEVPYGARLKGFLGGINHLMVDEFQDTNLVQQGIIYALAPPLQEGSLFVVGDAKQSIYRFRQAQVSVFNQTAKTIEEVTGCPAVSLRTSFRSHHALVQALNDLFNIILVPAREQQADYEASPGPLTAARQIHPEMQTPVEMLLIPKTDPSRDGTLNMEEARIWEAGWIGQRLHELKRSQFSVWDKDMGDYRPFEFKDAAVLFRATTSLPLYEAVFKDLGLPYLTVSGRGYYDRPEVQDLIALLAALANPADDLNLAAVLRSPLFSLSDETLYRLRWHHSPQQEAGEIPKPIPYKLALSSPAVTNQPDLVDRAHEILEDLWGQVDRVEVWQLLRSALDLTAYETTMMLSDGKTGRALSNVKKFLTLARDRGEFNLFEFINRLRDLRTREAREGEALGREPESGAVQLMSIHQAKGLEFPVVVLADLGRGKRRSGSSSILLHDPAFGIVCKVRDPQGDWVAPAGYAWGKWLDEAMEEAENKRLLYVAATRSADLLLLCGRTGDRYSWLTEILTAWSLEEEGPSEEVISYGDYGIRLYRPEKPVVVEKGWEELESRPTLEIHQIPSLALPLTQTMESRPSAVTKWIERSQDKVVDQEELYPAQWKQEISPGKRKVPRRLVGDIVHKVLAQWTPLLEEDGKRFPIVAAFAREVGVSKGSLPEAVWRSEQILSRLRNHPIYEQVNQAVKRFHEIPFTLSTPGGILHGVIDLLYLDQKNQWHLVDWKTDWAPQAQIESLAARYQAQVGYYAQAVQVIIGIRPETWIYFLEPKIVSVEIKSNTTPKI